MYKEHVESWSKKVIQFSNTISQHTVAHTTDDNESQAENIDEAPKANKETLPEEGIEFQDPVKGDFVTMYLESHGKKQSVVAQILEMDDDVMQAQLLFMKKDDKHGSLYFWPLDDDVSWENYFQILVVLGQPELCDSISTNRCQFFGFKAHHLAFSDSVLKLL